MLGQIVEALRRAARGQIFLRRIEMIVHGEQLALDEIGLHRRAHADGEIGLALRQIEFAILEHQMHLKFGEFGHEFLEPRQQPIGAEPVA